jgi:xanthine dehydrogenase accessory factor
MFDEYFRTAHELMRAGRPFATATVVRAERPTSGKPGDRALITADGTLVGWIGGSCAQPTVIREALAAIAEDRSRLIRLSPEPGVRPVPEGIAEVPLTCFSGGTLDIFIEPHHPRPRLLLVGSLPVAQALAHLGHAMNYHVIAVDPTESDAMAHADEVVRSLEEIVTRITPLTFVVIATHGEFDEPALTKVLATDAPYVGLVASRKRGEAVLDALAAEGVARETLARVRYPAGLDIHARRGDEIALGIMAEIVKTRRSLERLAGTGDRASDIAAATSHTAPRPGAPARPLAVLRTPQVETQDAAASTPGTATDPVCGMSVRIEGALHTHEFEGRTFYFCCGGCRARFAKDPHKFLAQAS